MIKFIERKSSEEMLQFIVNLLYLGMKSENGLWAEDNGTERAVRDLLSVVSDDFIKTAAKILLNGGITITVDRRLAKDERRHINIEGYQNIIDALRELAYVGTFSKRCECHFKKLTEVFSVSEDLHMLKYNI